MAIDYAAGADMTAAVTACTSALKTLQQLARSADADPALTTAEATSYNTILADQTRSDAWKLQQCARRYINVITELSNDLIAAYPRSLCWTAARQMPQAYLTPSLREQ